MSTAQEIAAVEAATAASRSIAAPAQASSPSAATERFADVFARGMEFVEQRVDRANTAVRAFALDDSMPVHEVTMALGEARLAVELAVQVRTRVVEAYRDLMTMQL